MFVAYPTIADMNGMIRYSAMCVSVPLDSSSILRALESNANASSSSSRDFHHRADIRPVPPVATARVALDAKTHAVATSVARRTRSPGVRIGVRRRRRRARSSPKPARRDMADRDRAGRWTPATQRCREARSASERPIKTPAVDRWTFVTLLSLSRSGARS
eukprot:7403-Pelagococcus_subviridis.AAC.3